MTKQFLLFLKFRYHLLSNSKVFLIDRENFSIYKRIYILASLKFLLSQNAYQYIEYL